MIKKILKHIYFIKDLPKSLYLNFKCLPFKQAIHMPIHCGSKVILKHIRKGSIRVDAHVKRGMVMIGSEPPRSFGLGGTRHKTSFLCMSDEACLTFRGICVLGAGVTINMGKGSELIIGKNFSTNALCNFFVQDKIKIGDDTFFGWNISIRDNDGHKIIDRNDGHVLNEPRGIEIGDRVWICSDVTVMKGVSITSDCIVACNSLVLKNLSEPHAIYGGNPIRILKSNIEFIRDAHS